MAADAFAIELALERLAARLASELPTYLAERAPAPTLRPTELAAIQRGLAFPTLRSAAVQLLRVATPLVLEADSRVAAARAQPRTWDAWRALSRVRDDAAREHFGHALPTLVHGLAGIPHVERADAHAAETPDGLQVLARDVVTANEPGGIDDAATGARNPAWHAADGIIVDDAQIRAAFVALGGTDRTGALAITRSATSPRTIAVERGHRVTLVLPTQITTPAQRFAVLHELGHALLWLAPSAREWPRLVDEAVAAACARTLEDPASPWHSPLAAAARQRRTAIARMLANIEAGALSSAPRTRDGDDAVAPTFRDGGAEPDAPTLHGRGFASTRDDGDAATLLRVVPEALWTDPFAQQIYADAELLADALATLRGAALVAAAVERAEVVDRAAWLDRER